MVFLLSLFWIPKNCEIASESFCNLSIQPQSFAFLLQSANELRKLFYNFVYIIFLFKNFFNRIGFKVRFILKDFKNKGNCCAYNQQVKSFCAISILKRKQK